MRTFIENCLHFMKNCIRPHYKKLKPLKSGFIENLIFENNRDPWPPRLLPCHHAQELRIIVVDQLLSYVGGELHGVGGVDGSVPQKPGCHSGGEAAFVQCHYLAQNLAS